MNESMATKKKKRVTSMPKQCTFSAEDWTVLSQYWYPVATIEEVTEKPTGIKLLDVHLVLYRANGKIIVARDLCLHRGVPLSMGWVEGDEIVCPYHGFRYGPEGNCTSIPAHPDAKISPRLCITIYPTVERYGLVWTSLAGEEENIPPLEVWDDEEYLNILPPFIDIAGSAGRQMEGFLDVAHFAWVHSKSFADRNNAFVPSYKVDKTDYGLHVEYVSTVSNYGKSQQHLEPPGFKWLRVFDVYPPFAARLTVHFPNNGKLFILNCASPVSARQTRMFSPMARNFDKDAPIEDTYEFNLQIFNEDREMVENQKPEELPLDLQAEAHIAADKTSINYRQILRQMGLGENYTS
ncbi:aromatic ring-hydroxylating dioxygenase subunit alpha [Peribacillus asahii]|uniref:aromatic ring-hydroxylating dioxygenase subunit alpha n=1 Tax=Peribacillus asahii TaxID=228899 RepID=UPI00207A8946|nr:aromatic ring-hydroxylating dioxygenase subunit alpha [Peribacillus asahii]USK60576.1 aromatic ring-hydroxylating dioxygenase subunit alpha [Peribacillus asahii]